PGFLRKWLWRSVDTRPGVFLTATTSSTRQTSRWQQGPSTPTTNRKRLHFRLHWQNWEGSGAIRSTVNQLKQQRDIWSRRSGLNGRPAVYETAALPTELRRRGVNLAQLQRG